MVTAVISLRVFCRDARPIYASNAEVADTEPALGRLRPGNNLRRPEAKPSQGRAPHDGQQNSTGIQLLPLDPPGADGHWIGVTVGLQTRHFRKLALSTQLRHWRRGFVASAT